MKKLLFVFTLLLSGICCFPFIQSKGRPASTPAIILLQDTDHSTTLQASRNGEGWEITGGDAGRYLSAIARSALDKPDLANFQEIKIVFDKQYTMGTLSGKGTDPKGMMVPVGVQYKKVTQSGEKMTMTDTYKHTCSAVGCACCDFIRREDGSILGCKCRNEADCPVSDKERAYCGHTITTKE